MNEKLIKVINKVGTTGTANYISSLECEIKERDEEIAELKEKLEAWGKNTLIETLKIRLEMCESLLLKFVPDKRTIQWSQRELKARDYFEQKPLVRPLDYKEAIEELQAKLETAKDGLKLIMVNNPVRDEFYNYDYSSICDSNYIVADKALKEIGEV